MAGVTGYRGGEDTASGLAAASKQVEQRLASAHAFPTFSSPAFSRVDAGAPEVMQ